MFTYAYPQLVCCPSYFKYQLKSIMVSTEKQEDNNHYYTFAKYGEQFYRRDENSHVRMMFDAALEYISGNTKLLSWSYGGVYTCLQCKDADTFNTYMSHRDEPCKVGPHELNPTDIFI
ncbi:unnamed protein product [Rotaria socialis]|uniref:Uncharacterized protein n=1 Tax=Rotaria socialis TaxID=392032 RepID=A0A817YYT7_9BILA|nr:unnamed protein product [Rotaria socialis]CAF4440824.1 unnamed protein product [Rotaria socialis]